MVSKTGVRFASLPPVCAHVNFSLWGGGAFGPGVCLSVRLSSPRISAVSERIATKFGRRLLQDPSQVLTQRFFEILIFAIKKFFLACFPKINARGTPGCQNLKKVKTQKMFPRLGFYFEIFTVSRNFYFCNANFFERVF